MSASPQTPRLVLFPEHVGDQLGVTEHTARRWLASGRLGHTVRIGKRRGILLTTLSDTLTRWERDQEEEGDR
ncbi:MAG: hypothetical protein ACYS0K_18965 [Planctomycetota bacterium]|jgi:predicted site-specific integrase-resolvase